MAKYRIKKIDRSKTGESYHKYRLQQKFFGFLWINLDWIYDDEDGNAVRRILQKNFSEPKDDEIVSVFER